MIKSIDPEKAATTEADRGRLAMRPRQITYRGWWDVLWRVKDQLEADNVPIVAGGLALFGLLAVFPTLAAAVAIYGLVASPEAITAHVQAFSGVLPEAGLKILEEQLQTLINQRREQLTVGVIVGSARPYKIQLRASPSRWESEVRSRPILPDRARVLDLRWSPQQVPQAAIAFTERVHCANMKSTSSK